MSSDEQWSPPTPVDLTDVEARLPIPDDVVVAEAPLPTPGPLGVWSARARVILLQLGLAPDERLFTLAHELAHCLLGHAVDGPAQEAEADELASTLIRKASS